MGKAVPEARNADRTRRDPSPQEAHHLVNCVMKVGKIEAICFLDIQG